MFSMLLSSVPPGDGRCMTTKKSDWASIAKRKAAFIEKPQYSLSHVSHSPNQYTAMIPNTYLRALHICVHIRQKHIRYKLNRCVDSCRIIGI